MLELRRLLVGAALVLTVMGSPCLAEDTALSTSGEGVPLPRPTAVPPPARGTRPASLGAPAGRPLPAWIPVRLPDGRPAWAPTSSMLITSFQPQAPERVVDTARRLMGVPYRWGGETPNGVDCSGFVEEVFRLCGHRLPRLADAQYAACTEVLSSDMQVGDLVFFTTYLPGPSHVGIYTGEGRFIHASSSRGVTISALEDRYYAARYLGARRPPAWVAPPPSTPVLTTVPPPPADAMVLPASEPAPASVSAPVPAPAPTPQEP